MTTRILARSMLTKLSLSSPSLSLSLSTAPRSSFSAFLRLRPVSVAAASVHPRLSSAFTGIRSLATRASTSSLNDPNPNWSNRPPKETILLDGCDFEHWLVVMEKPEGEPTRDEIIDSYIKTLATVVGSEEEARMKIYSVSTRCYFAFGCLVSEELSYKLKEIPRVRWVLPDSYLDVRNKDYGGEPFINGQAVPYDPKYHEEWIKNNARAQERNRRNDRPRNFDRSRNFERRRENMQSRDFQNRDMPPPPPPSPNVQNPATGGMGGAPQHNMGVPPPYQNMPQNNMGGMPQNMGGMPQNNMGGMPQNNMGGVPQNMGRMMPNMGGGMPPPPNSMGGMPHSNMGGVPPSANSNGGMPHNNMGGMAHNNMGGMSHNMGGVPPSPNSMGGMPHNMGGGMPPTPNNMGGGMPPTPNNMGGVPPSPNSMGGMPHNNMGGGMPPPPNSMGGVPQNNMGRMPPPPNSMGGMPPNDGGGLPPNNMGVPPRSQGNVPNYQNSGGYQGEQYQNNNYGQNLGNIPGGNPYQN